jgi:hypothetical protein
MPKAKWGAGDNMLTADDINNAEVPETRTRYSGPLPPSGTYRFTIQSLKQGVSDAGNDKVTAFVTLDGTWKSNHKQFDGAPVWQHLALTQANAPQVRNFLDSIGATPADLLNGSIVDENGYITKLGKVGDPVGIQVYGTVQHSKVTAQYPDKRLEIAYAGWLMVDDEGDSADAAGPAGTDGEEPPF